jgi:glycosyltransferase involved in cell wall biosynthesis
MSNAPLRLAIATPWNDRSAIARATHAIAKELRDLRVQIVIVRTETGEARALPSLNQDFPIAEERGVPAPQVGVDVDAICYVIGNYFPFHARALRLMAEQPGIVVLHDAYLRDLADGWLHAAGMRGDTALLHAALGLPEIPADATLEQSAHDAPLVEWPAAMAIGAVVHARHYLDRVVSACPGPVAMLPLPGEDLGVPTPRRRNAGDPIRLLTVGHVNPNKLTETVVGAIAASSRLRSACSYRIAGPVEPAMRDQISSAAERGGVEVAFTGWLSDADLRLELAAADGIVCLRRPILEGASGSAIEGLLSGRPVVVCDAGFYAEIPDELVLKVPKDANKTALIRRLEQILDEPAAMEALGVRARAWALKTFTAKRYAAGLVELVHASLKSGVMVGLVRRQVAVAGAWGLQHDDGLYARLEAISRTTFGS